MDSKQKSSRRSSSNNRGSKAFEPSDVNDSEDSERDDRRDDLKSHKQRSSSRRNLDRSRSSRRHMEKDASDSRSERKLVLESSSRRNHSSRLYEREDSQRLSKHLRRSDNGYSSDGDDKNNRSNNAIDNSRERTDGQTKRLSHSRRGHSRSRDQQSQDRRSLSRHREGFSRSETRQQHRSESKRFKEEQESQSFPSILPASSSQTQAAYQFSDLESPTHSMKKSKKQKRKREKRKPLLSARNLFCCGCNFLSVIIVVVVTVILLQKRVKNQAAYPLFEPPSSSDCIAISKGYLVTPGSPRRFQIDLQVELAEDVYSISPEVVPSAKESMQTNLVPMLADCPEDKRRELQRTSSLPQYIIANGIVVNTMLNPNAELEEPNTSQQSFSSRLRLLVIIDLWLQEEVPNRLVIDKIRECLRKLGKAAIFESQVQIVDSVVLDVEALPTLDDITGFPTVSPTSHAPSLAPSEIISRSPTNLPSLHPTGVPSELPSAAPSGLPSTSPSLLPSSEPSQAPSTLPSSIPTAPPTSPPTKEPTAPPTTLFPTIEVTKTPIPVDRSVDVVIVGAGAAGITAAYHLEQEGLSVVLLEAANRYGGRMKQDSTSWDVSLGLGPEWIHVDNPNDMLSRIVGRSVNKQTIAEPNLAHRWTGTTLAYNPPGRWSGDYRWMGGTWWDFFDQELASNLEADTIVLNSVVQTIDYESYKKPVVFLTNGRRYEGSYVIVTASVRTLQLGEINFIPSLPSSYTTAINNIEMDIAVKVFLEFSEKFYPDVFALDSDFDNYSSDCDSSRHGERLFYDPTVGRITSTNILGMFTYANIADLYTGQEESAVIQTVLNLLDQIFNGRASQTFVKGVVQDWAREPHIRTAYTKYGSSSYRQRLREPIDDRLYFAGEAVRTPGGGWGYVHGAAYCGKDVAEEIISRIRG